MIVIVDQILEELDGHAIDILVQLFACSSGGRLARHPTLSSQTSLVRAANDYHQQVAETVA